MGTINLRLQTGLFLDWLMLCLRHGWLASPRHVNRNPARPSILCQDLVARFLTDREQDRIEHRLYLPYGHGAEAFGGYRDPPSVRAALAAAAADAK
jgi:hypothetical protein